jgi:hypothetical protein
MSGSDRRRFFIIKAQEKQKELDELIKKIDVVKVNGGSNKKTRN